MRCLWGAGGEEVRWTFVVRISYRAISTFPTLSRCRGSHLLAQGCDVAGRFDDAFAAVVVLVQLIAEDLEHGHKGGWRSWGVHCVGVVGAFDAGHCSAVFVAL